MRVRTALLVFLALPACSYRLEKASVDSQGAVPSFTPGQLSYALVSQYVLTPKCVRCHGTSGGINLDSYPAVLHNITAVQAAALEAKSMPRSPVPPLTASEADMLRAWIEAGAPEQAIGNGPLPPPPPPLQPTFASIHDGIFAKKCFLCHNPGGSAKDVPLDTANDLLTSPDDLVLPGDPDNSYLAILISRGARKPMPPVSSGLSLTTEEVQIIKEWIKNGAKE